MIERAMMKRISNKVGGMRNLIFIGAACWCWL